MADRVVFGRYLILAGSIRFAIELVRVNEPVAGPFTLAQLFSAAVAIAGIALLATKGTPKGAPYVKAPMKGRPT
jgi:prolipoprotein diacylglyceryltransferase